MNNKLLVPRLLALPRPWWLAASVFALLAVISIGVRSWAGKTQNELLRKAGWVVYDIRKVDSKIQSNDAIWYLTLKSDGNIWARIEKGFISLNFDGQDWQGQKLVDEWPFMPYKAPNVYDSLIKRDDDGRIWTRDDNSCSGSYPDEWCSCVITSEWKTRKETFKIDIPDSSCNHVNGITSDQAGKLWVTFEAGDESQFGLASYTEKQWTFYETGDIPDPLLKPDRLSDFYGARNLVPDFNGDLWLSLYSGPYIVRINPTSSNLSADPVPDRILLVRQVSNTLAWSAGVLFGLVVFVAAWSTYLNSKAGLAWAQQQREKSLQSTVVYQPPPRSQPVYRSRRFIILTTGLLFVIWNYLSYHYWLTETGYSEIALSWQGLLFQAGISFGLGVGSVSLVYSGIKNLKSASSPTKVLIGNITLLFGVLILLASLWLVWIVPILYFTG